MRYSTVNLARKSAAAIWRSSMPQSSYYKKNQFSPSLQRARRDYLIPNALTGFCICGFVVSVYAYTIHIVSQDEFEDVPIPDGPAPVAGSPHTGLSQTSGGTATSA